LASHNPETLRRESVRSRNGLQKPFFSILLVEKRHPEGEFARVVKALLAAGSPMSDVKYPTGDAVLDEVLSEYI